MITEYGKDRDPGHDVRQICHEEADDVITGLVVYEITSGSMYLTPSYVYEKFRRRFIPPSDIKDERVWVAMKTIVAVERITNYPDNDFILCPVTTHGMEMICREDWDVVENMNPRETIISCFHLDESSIPPAFLICNLKHYRESLGTGREEYLKDFGGDFWETKVVMFYHQIRCERMQANLERLKEKILRQDATVSESEK